MDVLLDASAIMAVILSEPNGDKVIKMTENAVILSPDVISFEIGNALINLLKRKKISEDDLLKAYKVFSSIPIRNIKIDMEKALKIACKFNIYAYDAYYLETAIRLKLPLLTFDEQIKKISMELNITLLDDSEREEL